MDYQIGCIVLNAALNGKLQMHLLKPNIYISVRLLKKNLKGFLKSSNMWCLNYNFNQEI